MGKIEDRILDILNEDVSYEIVGGPSPSETLKGPLDYAKNVKKATVPQAHAIPGVGEIGNDEADQNDPITDVVDDLDEDEDDDKKKKDDGDDDSDKEDLEETFAALLARLAEEEDDEDDEDEDGETSLMDDNGGEPDETLPDVDSMLDSPDKLVTKAPGIKVAEEEGEMSLMDDNGGEPEETLPGASIDSMTDSPDKLVTPAPGAKTPDTVVEDEDDDEDEDDEDDEDKKKKDMSEDINAIFAGIKLSESAKTKAATIFKAALTSRVNEEKSRVQRIATKKLKEAFAVLKARSEKKQGIYESKLTNQVDRYLNYVVENWMKENRLAVERGIRAELAEDFIRGLKNLFVEHYIEVPESKVDVVATLGKKVTKLESKLNETVESNVKLRSTVNAYRKEEVVRAVSSGLPETQREKLAKLAEGVDYSTRKEFGEKLMSLRESYFPKKTNSVKKEEPLFEQTTKKPNTEMSVYTQTLSKFKKN
jgi:hypothetical protein